MWNGRATSSDEILGKTPVCAFCGALVTSGLTNGITNEIVEYDEHCIPCQDSSDDPEDPMMAEWANLSPLRNQP